jgi:hypothetical protein
MNAMSMGRFEVAVVVLAMQGKRVLTVSAGLLVGADVHGEPADLVESELAPGLVASSS